MTKQLVDLSIEEKDKVDRFSRKWKINYTQAIKRMIKEFPEQRDLFNLDEMDLGEKLW